MSNYKKETNRKYTDKLRLLEKELPLYCRQYFSSKNLSLSPRTLQAYAEDITLFLRYIQNSNPELSSSKISELPISYFKNMKSTDIDAFLAFVTQYEGNDGTIRENELLSKKRKLAAIRELYRYLYKQGLVDANPAALVDTPKVPNNKQVRALDSDEKKKLLTAITTSSERAGTKSELKALLSERDKAIVLLFLGTGIRVSELVGLNIDDIDYNEQCFSIIAKGGKITTHYFNDMVLDQLLLYLYDIRPLLHPSDDESALFVSMRGTRITVRTIEILVKKYSTESFGETLAISPHKLRSTYGTDLLAATGDIALVSENLGHADISTTKRYYMGQDIARLKRNKHFDIFPKED